MTSAELEHLKELGFNTPWEIASSGNDDPRTEEDLVADEADKHLLEVFNEGQLFEGADDKRFSREFVMDIARRALAEGIQITLEDPEAMKQFVGPDYLKAKKTLEDAHIVSAQDEINALPETPNSVKH